MKLLLLAALACKSSPAAKPASPKTIELDLKNAPIHEVFRAIAERARVNLTVDPDVTGTISIQVHDAPWRGVLDRIARDHGLRIEQTGPMLHVANATTPPSAPKQYTGAPIALDLHDAPIRDVAQLIAARAQLEILVDDDVQAAVTIRLKEAPWDLALDLVARKYELDVTRTGGTIRLSRRR